MKFDHIGIVVRELAEGRQILSSLVAMKRWTEVFEDRGIGVYVQFGLGTDGPCFELIAPLNSDSPVTGALKSNKNILNHVAYLVTDLEGEAERFRGQGCFPVGHPQPAVAYCGKRVQFFQSPLNLLIELIEAPDHEHALAHEE